MLQVFTILKESFWSAAASRLLYVEIIGALLILLLLAPLGYTEQVSYQVHDGAIVSPRALARSWSQAEAAGESGRKVLWQQLDESQKQQVQTLADSAPDSGASPRGRGRGPSAGKPLVEIFNSLIEESNFETDDYWTDRIDGSEARQLLERKGSLSTDNLKRLRRLLIQESFRGQLQPPSDSSIAIGYVIVPSATFNLQDVSRMDLESIVRIWIPYILDKFFLTIGIMFAILVTASLIPQMLEEGSLYLLLSKPMSRPVLLVTKYLGSGILILIISTILLSGVWLILGFRFSIWINELLWFIPLAVVIYLIYFSVTVGVGLVFRNSIIAIMATLIFGLLCYSLSIGVWVSDGLFSLQRRSAIMQFDDQIYSYDARGRMLKLENDNQWKWVFFRQSESLSDFEFDIIATGYVPPNVAQAYYLSEMDLVVGEMGDITSQSRRKWFCAARLNGPTTMRHPQSLGMAPEGTVGFVQSADGRLLAISRYGTVWRLGDAGMEALRRISEGESVEPTSVPSAEGESDSDAASENPEDNPSEDSEDRENLDWELAGSINESGPDEASRFVYDAQQEIFWSLGRTGLARAERNSQGDYQVTRSFPIRWNWQMSNRTPLLKVGQELLVPLRHGPLVVLNADSLEVEIEFELPFENVPVSAGSHGDQAAVAYRQDGVWIYDGAERTFEKLPISGLMIAAAYNPDGNLLLVRDVDRVMTVDPETGKVIKSIQPERGTLRWAFEAVIKPLYLVLPKPNECYALVESLANSEFQDREASESTPDDVGVSVDTIAAKTNNPWNPLLSSIAFAFVLMVLNCLYFMRQQF